MLSSCKNNATCQADNFGNYTCLCSTGYTGLDCQIEINECESIPCQNGGTCKETEPGSYECKCLPGFTGFNCESSALKLADEDLCRNFCKYNSTCIVSLAFFVS